MAIKFFFSFLCGFLFFLRSGTTDHPRPWQMNFQEPSSPVMQQIYDMHHILLYVITIIAVVVIAALFFVIFKFRSNKNPVPSKTAHHTWLEITWTAIPAIIVLVMVVPSLKLLYFMDKSPPAEVTIKAIGHQWYWSYEYPDSQLAFESYIVEDKDIKEDQIRLLEVDNRVFLPIDTNIKVLLTSVDVLHSWAIPSLGIKTDTAPGRLNETWIKITKEGIYRGQCSELCGTRHAFMPIVIEAVSKEKYKQWLQQAKIKFA